METPRAVTREPKNEEAICAAVKRFIERRRNETLTEVDRPEKHERGRPAVELVLASSTARFVIEHTRVESFAGQIEDGQKFMALLEPLEAELAGKLPEGRYDLIVKIGASGMVNRSNSEQVRAALKRWVIEIAPTLDHYPDSRRDDLKWSITARPPEVPFDVTLQRWTRPAWIGPGESRVLVSRFTPSGDRESLRRERIKVALTKKLPKLAAAKSEHKADESVLALESDDIALANGRVIMDAVREELTDQQAEGADTIYLIETDRGMGWRIWLIQENGQSVPDDKCGPFDLTAQVQ